MKSNFQERKEQRLEAFKSLAAKNESLSLSKFEQSRKLADQIPFGQPILVGHHSEKRHRNHIKKIHNSMDAAVEASNKAKYYEDRAESLLANRSISSDDPNAIDKLVEKLERLEALQTLYKAINTIVRKKDANEKKVVQLVAIGLTEKTAAALLLPGNFGGAGIPSFRMTNNNAVIRNTRQRIQYLNTTQAIPASTEEINGVEIVVSPDDNRVQIFFPGKPDEAVRKLCKSHGFHWSHSLTCWMRQLNQYAIRQAQFIAASDEVTSTKYV